MKHIDGDFEAIAYMNSLGYRGNEFSFTKLSGTKRILVVGDSMVFGIGVNDNETYSYQLEKELQSRGISNIEVINAGYAASFSPDTYYLYLKNRGMALEPDLVLVGFFVYNDIVDLSETFWERTDEYGFPTKIISISRKVVDGFWFNRITNFKYKIPYLRDSHLFLLTVQFLIDKFGLFPDTIHIPTKEITMFGCQLDPKCFDNFLTEEQKAYQMLSGIKRLSDEAGIPLVVVLFPVEFQLNPGKYSEREPYLDYDNLNFIQKRIGGNLVARGIEYFDLFDTFNAAEKGTFEKPTYAFPNDNHLNALGNNIAASATATYLMEKNVIH